MESGPSAVQPASKKRRTALSSGTPLLQQGVQAAAEADR